MAALSAVLATCILIVRARFREPISQRIKVMLALSLVMVPHSGEVFMTITNIQWMVAPLLVVLALQENPRTGWQAGVDLAALCLAGLTGPFSVFWLPILILRPFLFGRTFYNGLFTGLAVAVAAVQLIEMQGEMSAFSQHVHDPAFSSLKTIAELSITRFGGYFFLGSEQRTRWEFAILAAATLGTVYLFLVSPRKIRLYTLMICAAALLVFASAMPRMGSDIGSIHPGTRYAYIPAVLICWFYAMSLTNPRRIPRIVACLLIGLATVTTVRHPSLIQPVDYHWKQCAKLIERGNSLGETVTVKINPGWSIPIQPRPSIH